MANFPIWLCKTVAKFSTQKYLHISASLYKYTKIRKFTFFYFCPPNHYHWSLWFFPISCQTDMEKLFTQFFSHNSSQNHNNISLSTTWYYCLFVYIGLSDDDFHFDKHQDGPARYNIIHFRRDDETKTFHWVRVGEYNEGVLELNMSGTKNSTLFHIKVVFVQKNCRPLKVS